MWPVVPEFLEHMSDTWLPKNTHHKDYCHLHKRLLHCSLPQAIEIWCRFNWNGLFMPHNGTKLQRRKAKQTGVLQPDLFIELLELLCTEIYTV